jgi:phage terminase large subunit-like protein
VPHASLPAGNDWRDVQADLADLERVLAGRRCFGGLDLARVYDLSAFVLLFPPTSDPRLGALGSRWIALPRFWVPEDDILRRARRDRVPYDVWRDQGFLTATPGNATDFAFIEREIVANLQEQNLPLVQFGQGFLSLAAPTAELERLVIARKLWHGGHPVLRWNASNVAVRQDPAGNIKPDKERSRERIDGISALVNALGRALLREGSGRSIYETRGLLII